MLDLSGCAEKTVEKEAGYVLAVMRHICMNLLKQETSLKRGIKGKRYRSVMDS